MLHPGEVVRDKDPRGLTIEADIVVITMFVRIKPRELSIGDSLHFPLIAVFLLMIFVLDAP